MQKRYIFVILEITGVVTWMFTGSHLYRVATTVRYFPLAVYFIALLLLPGIFHWQFILSPCYYCKVFSTDSPLYRIATTAKQCPLTALSIIVATTARQCPLTAFSIIVATTARQCPLTALSIIVATTDRYCPLAAPCITLLQLPGIVSLAAFRATMYYSQVLFTGSHLYCAAKAVLSTDSTLYHVATTARYFSIGTLLYFWHLTALLAALADFVRQVQSSYELFAYAYNADAKFLIFGSPLQMQWDRS